MIGRITSGAERATFFVVLGQAGVLTCIIFLVCITPKSANARESGINLLATPFIGERYSPNQLAAHGDQLSLHHAALFRRVLIADINRSYADGGGEDQSDNARSFPKAIVFPFSVLLIVGSLLLLGYGAYRGDEPLYSVSLIGLVPFAVGVMLAIFCLLHSPPPIFGFTLSAVSSAPPDRLAEDVGVIPVVLAELKLGDVERRVLGAIRRRK